MIRLTVETKTTIWYTGFNGNLPAAIEYFVGKFFNVGNYPIEKMEMVTTVKETID